MAKRKNKVKTGVLIKLGLLIIIIIVGIFGTKYLLYRQTNQFKLKEIGYSVDEIKTIEKELNDKQINSLLEKEYTANLTKVIKEKYFIYDNLDRYLAYYEKKGDYSSKDIVSVVNAGADQEFYTNIKDSDTSKGLLILVNKFNKLPENYQPDDIVPIKNWYAYNNHSIRKEVYDKYVEMWNAAKKDDLTLVVTSSFRDYNFQKELYDGYAYNLGEEDADKVSARPGHSEHQLGLALDIVTHGSIMDDFEETEEFKWLKTNSYKYGFILRYPKEKEFITGYSYESWHYRYVGVEVAQKIHDLDITFDEYYAYYVK